MTNIKVSDVINEVDNAISKSVSKSAGKEVKSPEKMWSEISEKHTLHMFFFVIVLPIILLMISYFIITNFTILPDSSNSYLFFILLSLSGIFSLSSAFHWNKKIKDSRANTFKLYENKVEISAETLDIVYDRLSLLVKIERKYDLNVGELTKIKNRFYETMYLMREHQDISFLNPKDIVSNY